jgi:hypothetical protein
MDLQFKMSEILKAIETHSNHIWFFSNFLRIILERIIHLLLSLHSNPYIFTQKKTGPKQIDPGISLFYPQDHHMPLIHGGGAFCSGRFSDFPPLVSISDLPIPKDLDSGVRPC